jgi:hypothetical protein
VIVSERVLLSVFPGGEPRAAGEVKVNPRPGTRGRQLPREERIMKQAMIPRMIIPRYD